MVAQRTVESTCGAVECAEVAMGHSDALLDHVPGIRLELYLELPTLCRVAFIGRLDPCEELCVIGDKLLERRELDPRLRCCCFVGGQDGLVQPCVALRRCGEELKRAFEGLWGKRRGVRDDVDQAIQRRPTCAASAPANRVGRTRYTRTRVARYVRIEVEWMRLVDDDGPRCGCPARGGLSLGCAVVFHLHVFNGRVYIHARHLCYWSACSAAVRSTRGSERGSQVSISRDSRPANRLSLMALLKSKKKSTAASTVGAPAQHNQSSRKGKKAWRKNVDIEDLEEKLESLREEERTLGCAFFFLPRHCWSQATIARHYKKRQTANCSSSIPKATTKARLSALFSTHHLTIVPPLSPKVSPALLPRLPEIASNNHTAFCHPCSLCSAPKISRECPRQRTATPDRTKRSPGPTEQHRGPLTTGRRKCSSRSHRSREKKRAVRRLVCRGSAECRGQSQGVRRSLS
jgi:hypothetical protein